jgi:hypothetical protein
MHDVHNYRVRDRQGEKQVGFSKSCGQIAARLFKKLARRVRARSKVSCSAHKQRRTAASILAKMGVPRLVIGKILNHVEPGVTKVCDRCSYDKDKQEALNTWGARLAAIIEAQQEDAVDAGGSSVFGKQICISPFC